MFGRAKERNIDVLDISPAKCSDVGGCEVDYDPKTQEETSPSASVARITHSLQRMPIVSPYAHHNPSMGAPTPSPMRPYKPRSLSFHSSPMKTPHANPRSVLRFTPTPTSPGHSHSFNSQHIPPPSFQLESPAPSRSHASHLLATPSSPKHQPSVPLVSSTPVTAHTAAAHTAVHRLSVPAPPAQQVANKPGLSKRRVESNGSIRGKNISNALVDIASSSVVSSVTTTTRTASARDGKLSFSTTTTSTIAEENDKENLHTNFNLTSQDKEEISITKGDSKDDVVFVSAEHYSAVHVEGFQIIASPDAVELEEPSEPLERDSNRMKKKHRTNLVRSQSLSIGMVEPGESISSALARTHSNPSPLRRTLSQTFEDLEDQLSEVYQNSLPVASISESSIARICPSTMAGLLNGQFRGDIDRFVIADCRFSYEFHGGHIPGAFHVDSKQKVERFYKSLCNHPGKIAVIFHCEFSRNRGPKSAQYFRQLDRERNQYPRLSFPDVYILNGGYKEFVARYPLHCDPVASYVSMWDNNYNDECKQSLNACRKSWGRSIGLSECDMNRERSLARSQTLAASGCDSLDSDDFESGSLAIHSENLVGASPLADRSAAAEPFEVSLDGTARSSISTQSSDSSMTASSIASSSPPSPLSASAAWPSHRAAVHDANSDELPPLYPASVPAFPSLREALRNFPSQNVRSLTLRSPSNSFLAAPTQSSRVDSFSLLSSTGSPSPAGSSVWSALPLPDSSRHRRRAFSVSLHPRTFQDDDEDS